jgi:eukaryotic-like serine/threonine-protein kinase
MDEDALRTPLTAAPPLTPAWRQPTPYPQEYAGFWRRFLASGIDGLVLSAANIPLNAIVNRVLERALDPDAAGTSVWRVFFIWVAVSLTAPALLGWCYDAGMESSSWQATLGKRVLGIVVTDHAGDRISFGRATGRHFAEFLSFILFGAGYLIQPFTEKRQALHDIIAGTLVVRA